MAVQGSYPLNGRSVAGTDTCTGVVTGQTADIPLSVIAAFVLANSPASGTTANRPIPSFVGQPYLDTTLGIMIWALQISPSIWIDAAGVPV